MVVTFHLLTTISFTSVLLAVISLLTVLIILLVFRSRPLQNNCCTDFSQDTYLAHNQDQILKNQDFLVNFSNYLHAPGNIEHKISYALQILGKFLSADRIYIFEDIGSGKMSKNTHEWINTGIIPENIKYHRIIYKLHLPDFKETLMKEGILYSEISANLPAEYKELLTARNIQSLITLPLYAFSDFFGFLGIDFCLAKHTPDTIEIGFLKTIAIMLSTTFERKLTIIELNKSEEKFKNLFNNSSDAILIYLNNGEIIETNQLTLKWLNYTREELLSRNINQIFVPAYLEKMDEKLILTNEKGLIVESEFLSKNGKPLPVEINCRQIRFNNQDAIICMARDIADRKEMEREIIRVIMNTEEKERGRIARDLHDGLAPLLSSIKLYVKVIGMSKDLKKRESMVTTTNEVVDEALNLIKEITHNISPHVLNDFGLAVAVHAFCKRISLTKAFDIKFDSNIYDQRFHPDIEIVVFRVLKELVNNTLKHASAKSIQIFLLRTGETLSLVYSDDGIGFDVSSALASRDGGMGLANIINRIESIKGSVHLESTPGKGFQVKLEVPL